MKTRNVAVEELGLALRAASVLLCVSILAVFILALDVSGAGAGEPGEAIQLSTCLGTFERAEAMAAEYRRMMPGLVTEVRPKSVGKRTVHQIWAKHPDKTPEAICKSIGRAGCLEKQEAAESCDEPP